nr:hypothetical protein CFP56_01447 [Quercus suber]
MLSALVSNYTVAGRSPKQEAGHIPAFGEMANKATSFITLLNSVTRHVDGHSFEYGNQIYTRGIEESITPSCQLSTPQICEMWRHFHSCSANPQPTTRSDQARIINQGNSTDSIVSWVLMRAS